MRVEEELRQQRLGMAERRARYLRMCPELDARALEVKGMTAGEQGEWLTARRMLGEWGWIGLQDGMAPGVGGDGWRQRGQA